MYLRHQRLTRYILPLREGGSLPVLGEADDSFKYVVKLSGAGHGNKALIAELTGTLAARAFKLDAPEPVLLDLDNAFGITEPDEEVRQLLKRSEGLNLGLHFLSRASTFDPMVDTIDPLTASKIVWLDSFLTNVDRTRLNVNMMMFNGSPWLIDHGASLYFHHSWRNADTAHLDPFDFIERHALLPLATQIGQADKLMRQAITPRTLSNIVDMIPAGWLVDADHPEMTTEMMRQIYRQYFVGRLANSHIFTERAIEAQRHATPYPPPPAIMRHPALDALKTGRKDKTNS